MMYAIYGLIAVAGVALGVLAAWGIASLDEDMEGY